MKSKQPTPRRTGPNRLACVSLLVAMAAGMAGCNDPYSRTRIAKREEHLRQFEGDVRASEARRAKRLTEAGETAERWWVRDRERFDRRWPTIGDYIW